MAGEFRQMTNLGESVVIKGQILGREDLTIHGEMDGPIDLPGQRLIIGPKGNVRANIKAREVIIYGKVQGNIEGAEKIEVRAEASLIGDIRTAQVVISDGSYFKGAVDIIRRKPEAASPAAATG